MEAEEKEGSYIKIRGQRRKQKNAKEIDEVTDHIITSNNIVHNLSYRMKENGRLVVAVMVVILKRGETHYNR